MRLIPAIVSGIACLALVYAGSNRFGSVPPLGKFLSPQQGIWQNAESAHTDYAEGIVVPGLKDSANIFLDERLVPHVFANNETDLYKIQGYLHARFRLFQMDLQTRAAEGRASEIAGEKAVNYDREQRRWGMRYAAELALKEMENEASDKARMDAYTAGVNAYIDQLTAASLPLEYKLLDLKPARWSNIRTALLLKMMAKMLTGETEHDLAYTNLRNIFSKETFSVLYPQVPDSLYPIVPSGTAFPSPGMVPVQPLSADSLYFMKADTVPQRLENEIEKGNGSNNWVVSGQKTASGKPILCNDPHLEMSLPSIWFEMQLSDGKSNSYGVSLPGSPYIIIGFNDSISWGVTNAQRDVKDYYEIKFQDSSRKKYWYNNQWVSCTPRIEHIDVRGGETVTDTVMYTVFGPVLYDRTFQSAVHTGKSIALRWAAHEPANEATTFYKLNRASNYAEFEQAIASFKCPGQNFVFASTSGDIALWQQGQFPARWKGQGLFVMPGENDDYAWQGFIPQQENPHMLNPEQGFLFSANQRPADSTYPYFIPGMYINPRATSLHMKLKDMQGITPEMMMALQYDYYNVLGSYGQKIIQKYTSKTSLTTAENEWLNTIMAWDAKATSSSEAQTFYQCWMDSLEGMIWSDDLAKGGQYMVIPDEETTLELMLRDSASTFYDDIRTSDTETIITVVTGAFKKAATTLNLLKAQGKSEWKYVNKPALYHIMDKDHKTLPAFSVQNLQVGGYGNIINAVRGSHGPSWRMIVHMTQPVQAFGVFPGGQSGNPGSSFFTSSISKWEQGKYYQLNKYDGFAAVPANNGWRIHLTASN